VVTPHTDLHPDDTKPPRENQQSTRKKRRYSRMEIFTGVIMLAAIIQAFAAGLTWWITDSALTETQLSNEREQRAWVLVDTVKLDGILAPEVAIDVVIDYKNFGKIPAHDVVMDIAVPAIREIPPKDFHPELTGAPISVSRSLMGPDHRTHARRPLRLPAKHADRVMAGTLWIYIVGKIAYRDDFTTRGDMRETVFCAYYLPNKTGMAFCAHANTAK
jgi:hypothetical protein